RLAVVSAGDAREVVVRRRLLPGEVGRLRARRLERLLRDFRLVPPEGDLATDDAGVRRVLRLVGARDGAVEVALAERDLGEPDGPEVGALPAERARALELLLGALELPFLGEREAGAGVGLGVLRVLFRDVGEHGARDLDVAARELLLGDGEHDGLRSLPAPGDDLGDRAARRDDVRERHDLVGAVARDRLAA